jgi:hypothetical protein
VLGKATWIGGTLAVAGACSPWAPREVEAAEPRAPQSQAVEAQAEPPPPPREALPTPAGTEPQPPPPPADEVADLTAVVARLEDPEAPALVLAEADVERLFQPPERATAPGLQAARTELDVVGDETDELVAVVSEGWFGEGFWVLLLEPLPGCWRVVAQARVDGVCRGLPRVGAVPLGERRWVGVQWVDSLSARARTQAQALLEPFEGRLELVARVTREGYLPGGPRALAVSYTLEAVELDEAEAGADLRLTYSVSATADETDLGPLLWATDEVAVRLRQPAPGRAFVPAEPAGLRAVDPDLFSTRALESWLVENAEQAGRLAREGEPAQKLVLLELAERVLERGGSPQARALIAALPPRDELEAAAAIR